MSGYEPARPAARRTILAALAIVSATLVVAATCQSTGPSRAASSSSAASRLDPPRLDHHHVRGRRSRSHQRRIATSTTSSRRTARGEADGAVPDVVTVFDDGVPAVANLDPDLLTALRQAATDAAENGVEIFVNGGWRSPKYQAQLLREAVLKYGSKAAAARWVATVDTSPHVSGDAVDIWPSSATAWLSEHGAAYGLCQIYRNERWHYELRPDARVRGCPPMYADPTHDSRMQQ